MSGIYIHGMDIPKHGSIVLVEVDENGDVYAAYDSGITKLAQYKAVPVPPHGDLIDRDALRDNNCDAFEINGADKTILAMDVSIIDDAPAIIPASE